MPIIWCIVFLTVMRSLSAALTATFVLFISGRCKSVASALVISLVLFLLPIMVYLSGREQVLMFCVPCSFKFFFVSFFKFFRIL